MIRNFSEFLYHLINNAQKIGFSGPCLCRQGIGFSDCVTMKLISNTEYIPVRNRVTHFRHYAYLLTHLIFLIRTLRMPNLNDSRQRLRAAAIGRRLVTAKRYDTYAMIMFWQEKMHIILVCRGECR